MTLIERVRDKILGTYAKQKRKIVSTDSYEFVLVEKIQKINYSLTR
jgi:hypothetical protein